MSSKKNKKNMIDKNNQLGIKINDVAFTSMITVNIANVMKNIKMENNKSRTPTTLANTDIALKPWIIKDVKLMADFLSNLLPRLVGKVSKGNLEIKMAAA